MAATGKKKKKKEQTMLAVAGIVVIAAAGVFFFLRGGSQDAPTTGSGLQALNSAAEINEEIEIRRDLFEDRILRSLKPYTPIQAADRWGRSNPFVPYSINVEDINTEDTNIENNEPAQDQENDTL